ncbi:bile acid:sodium symporter family protein [Pacificimonas flava]|uniref:Sodium-Bile acid symporter n=1 Tax=Pacificimonas flava TaxID=1234595 RepID=M2S9K0_9SPHN|nr:bile acid:sodium symporter family protein [Pacificimonas flava]EMD82065.1 Sodium - Bile acid symporter [Pacificimonas flava]MBB5280905.1 sodium/bile acid cotransporter 7 [Pacificimonas flava]
MLRIPKRVDRYSAALLASVLLASLLPLRGAGADIFAAVTSLAIALLFFLHGAKLSRAAIVGGLTAWRLHLVILAATFLLFPILGLGFRELGTLILAPSLASGFLFLALLPSTVQSSIAFTSIAGGNVPAAICSASLSNLIGIGLTPLLVAGLMGGAGTIALGKVETIALQLLLPFLLGHLSRPLTAGFVQKHGSLVSFVDRGSILLVVYTAFSAAIVQGLWQDVPAWQVAALVLLSSLLLAIVLLLTRGAARCLGFSRADEIAILFCGSKKSLASGVPMAAILFPAAAVGPVILPLMIFHQIQLLVCAVLARRYARQPLAAQPKQRK